MYVSSLKLQDFRNIRELSLDLSPNINVFYGENAQGKTNVLESIYLAGTTKSHRTSRDREMIRIGEEESHIRMEVVRRAGSFRIDMHLKKNKSKGVAVGGVPLRRAGELFRLVHLVFFSPEDLGIIKEGPGERRKFLDFIISSIDNIYLKDLALYQRCLTQRNHLLHDLFAHPDLLPSLDVWDAQLSEIGARIIEKRRAFVDELETAAAGIHEKITGGAEKLRVIYEPNTAALTFAERLRAGRQADIRMKTTCTGPHRDDFNVSANDLDLRLYGSQGQQRTADLSLKLSQIRILEEKTGERPILLLDDVLSELDRNRQNFLLESLENTQTLITCTGLDEFVEKNFFIDRVFYVEGGKVVEIKQEL